MGRRGEPTILGVNRTQDGSVCLMRGSRVLWSIQKSASRVRSITGANSTTSATCMRARSPARREPLLGRVVHGATALVCHQGGPKGAYDHWWLETGAHRPEDALTGLSYRHGGGWWDGPRETGGYVVQDGAHWASREPGCAPVTASATRRRPRSWATSATARRTRASSATDAPICAPTRDASAERPTPCARSPSAPSTAGGRSCPTARCTRPARACTRRRWRRTAAAERCSRRGARIGRSPRARCRGRAHHPQRRRAPPRRIGPAAISAASRPRRAPGRCSPTRGRGRFSQRLSRRRSRRPGSCPWW